MIKVKTEKDYLIKIVNYKGNLVAKIKFPKSETEAYNVVVNVVRLYERAKKNLFLTSALFRAIKNVLQTFYDTKIALHLILRNPYLNKVIKEILSKDEEDYQEDVIIGKVREEVTEFEVCSICSCILKEPAYVVFTKNGEIIKKSTPIGIKCLNRITDRLQELVTHVQISDNFLRSLPRGPKEVREKETKLTFENHSTSVERNVTTKFQNQSRSFEKVSTQGSYIQLRLINS